MFEEGEWVGPPVFKFHCALLPQAGFGEPQKSNLKALGCTDDNVEDSYIAGGIDT